jgi:hypothetical protein
MTPPTGAGSSRDWSARSYGAAGSDPERIFTAVAQFYGVDDATLARRHDPHLARAVAAWLCRRHTEAPMRVLAERLGLSRADGVPSLTRRLDARLKSSPRLAEDLEAIMRQVRSGTTASRPPRSVGSAHHDKPARVSNQRRKRKNLV